MLDEYRLVNSEHIHLTPLLFHYLWFRITDVCYGVKVVITSGWEGSKRINRRNNCNMFYETWKELCGLRHPKPYQQNADVGRCLAWKKRWELEHLSVYSSRNTNLLKNKRENIFSHGQTIWGTSYTVSLHAALGMHTTGDSEIPIIKERSKK